MPLELWYSLIYHLDKLICSPALLNFGFALFAADALIFVWLANAIQTIRDSIADTRLVLQRVRFQLEVTKDGFTGDEKKDTGCVASNKYIRKALDSMSTVLQDKEDLLEGTVANAQRIRERSMLLALGDIFFFVFAAVVSALPMGEYFKYPYCKLVLALAGIILAVLHYLVYVNVRRLHRITRQRICEVQEYLTQDILSDSLTQDAQFAYERLKKSTFHGDKQK